MKHQRRNGKKQLDIRRWVSLLLLACLLIGLVPAGQTQAASVPTLYAAISKDNVMALLNTYDRNGAFMVSYGTQIGRDWLGYYSSGDRLIDSLDTVVHEECHDYSVVGANKERMYVGAKKSVTVPYTPIYRTKQMTKSVPQRCRTSRFETYISKPTANLASNVEGVYGLLNEFNAYNWGMNNNAALFAYHDRFADDLNTWGSFIANGASNRLAYAEFKYYILHYMYYAKKHHPSIYRKIVANKKFKLAYKKTESHLAKLIRTYEADLPKIKAKIQAAGYNVDYTDEYFVVTNSYGAGGGMGLLTDEYSALMTELKKSPYQSIQRTLTK